MLSNVRCIWELGFFFWCVFNCCFCVSNAVLAASCIVLLNECFSNAIGIVAIPNALVTLLAISGMGGKINQYDYKIIGNIYNVNNADEITMIQLRQSLLITC